MKSLEFLQNWYSSNCDGDWEHNFGIKIKTLDNPGWFIEIGLIDTKKEDFEFSESAELSENDWYNISTKNNQLVAVGDAGKLTYLMQRIQDLLSV